MVDCLLTGAANKEIAVQLDISPKTVARHMTHIFKKSRTTSRAELIARVLTGG